MRSVSGIGRVAAFAAVDRSPWSSSRVLLFGGGGGGYTVKAQFLNAASS